MPPLRRSIKRLKRQKFNKLYTHFAVEITLMVIMVFTVSVNLQIRANSKQAQVDNKSLFFSYLNDHPEYNQKLVDAYGGTKVRFKSSPSLIAPALAASTLADKSQTSLDNTKSPLATLSGTALLKPNLATSDGSVGTGNDTQIYTVQPGDTVARIASVYGIDTNTIVWENNLSSSGTIKPGQELKILPGKGIKHTIKSGETLYGIASTYGVDVDTIMDDNGIEIAEHIFAGDEIFIRGGEKKASPAPQRNSGPRTEIATADVPQAYSGSSTGFVWPINCTRLSQGYWYRHRAIDIPCKYQPVSAVADGVVIESGYRGGYGYEVLLDHGNGYRTRYAHASELKVSAGDHVTQGQTIMISGNTGRSTGPHLHFEVIKNGGFLNPLNVLNR